MDQLTSVETREPNGSAGDAIKTLNWPTLLLILVTGGGNFIANQQGKTQLSYEQQEAIAKIREIHGDLDNFETGMKSSLNNQNAIMLSQTKLLENDSALLKEVHAVVNNLEAMRHADQMRGVPP